MKKTVFCGVLVLAVLSAAAGQATRRQIKRGFLKQHNIARREETNAADMLKLKWDRRLAKSAQSYADQCNFAHSTTEYRQEVSRARWDWIGENIYITTLMNPDDIVDMAINTWKKEKSYYNYSTHTCQPQKVCGHYLQMVWASTLKLGCGVRFCPSIKNNPFQRSTGATIVICHYGPGGNYRGVAPYKEGPQCSSCPMAKGRSRSCKKGLCA